MLKPLHVHVPYLQLDSLLPFLLEQRLQPEIAFKGPDLDHLAFPALRQVGCKLASAGLACTVHAPFMDLNPGALEPLVLSTTRYRFAQTLDAAEALGARLVVFHPGYDPWKYGGQDHLWLEKNLLFWPSLIERADQFDCTLALENIFEVRPDTLAGLLNFINSPRLGHCFDVGHWHLFSKTPLADWFSSLGTRIVHLHLHDNFGERDAHLPVGEGGIDFSFLFTLVPTLSQVPSMTLEAHSQKELLRSLAKVAPFLRVLANSDVHMPS